jgi:hypothetical protein
MTMNIHVDLYMGPGNVCHLEYPADDVSDAYYVWVPLMDIPGYKVGLELWSVYNHLLPITPSNMLPMDPQYDMRGVNVRLISDVMYVWLDDEQRKQAMESK